ncbi:MAG TPA: hypothetical protein VMH23_10675, partial [Bacteroidota bacterium]|nr:hypothetical protein [Bacteroidota bacterium]
MHEERQPGCMSTIYNDLRITNDALLRIGDATRSQSVGVDTTTFDVYDRPEVMGPEAPGISMMKHDPTFYEPGLYDIMRSARSFYAFGSIIVPSGTFHAPPIKDVQTDEMRF